MSDHKSPKPKFDLGSIVYTSDERFPGPWEITNIWPWQESGRGEWRYSCERPDGWKGRTFVRRIPGTDRAVMFRPASRITAWEGELYTESKVYSIPGVSMRRSEGGIWLP